VLGAPARSGAGDKSGKKSEEKSRKFVRFRTGSGRPQDRLALRHAGLGQLDRDPQIDLGQNLVEPVVA
jgi:hypothetical protein